MLGLGTQAAKIFGPAIAAGLGKGLYEVRQDKATVPEVANAALLGLGLGAPIAWGAKGAWGLSKAAPEGAKGISKLVRGKPGLFTTPLAAIGLGGLYRWQHRDSPKKASADKIPSYDAPWAQGAAQQSGLPDWLLKGSAAGADSSTEGWPDYFSYLTNPQINKIVAADIAAMQRPLVRQAAQRGRSGAKQVQSLKDTQADYMRSAGNIRRELEQTRKDYAAGERERAAQSEDAMTKLADRLLGTSVTSPGMAEERAQQALAAGGRERGSLERATETGMFGTSNAQDLMNEMSAVEEMQTARDIRDAEEQTRLDTDAINAQIGDIAAQTPALRQKYAAAMADYEAKRLSAAQDANESSWKAAMDLMKLQADSGGGGDIGKEYRLWASSATERGIPSKGIYDPETNEKIGVEKPIKNMLADPDIGRAIAAAFREGSLSGYGGPQAADDLIAYLTSLADDNYSEAQIKNIAKEMLGEQ